MSYNPLRKKNLPRIYGGSIQKNYWGMILKSEMFFNKKDPFAIKYLVDFKRRVSGNFKQKNLHPNFEFKIEEIFGINSHSYVQHTWINNVSRKFYLHRDSMAIKNMYREISVFNHICDSQRSLEGFDDEPEDEDKQIF